MDIPTTFWGEIGNFFSSTPGKVALATIFATVFATYFHIKNQRINQLLILRLDNYRNLRKLLSELLEYRQDYVHYQYYNQQEIETMLASETVKEHIKKIDGFPKDDPDKMYSLALIFSGISPSFRKAHRNLGSALKRNSVESQIMLTLYHEQEASFLVSVLEYTRAIKQATSHMNNYFDWLPKRKLDYSAEKFCKHQIAEDFEKILSSSDLHNQLQSIQFRMFDDFWFPRWFKHPKETAGKITTRITERIKKEEQKVEKILEEIHSET